MTNDSVFINQTLIRYCADRGIEFTRSRAYRKNDQPWIEQKNGSVVRRFAGYDRYSGRIAGQTMVHLYQAVRLHVNYFQPSFKLLEKIGTGPGSSSATARQPRPATGSCSMMSNRAAAALRLATHGLHRSDSALGAFLRRKKAHLGAPRAITATAHKLARLIYSMLRYGQDYVDAGAEYYES